MSGYILTTFATQDISDIWTYIAKQDIDAADRVEQALFDSCAFLSENPLCGHLRRDLTHRNFRFWTLTRYRRYTLVYQPDTDPIQILAIVHAGRDIRRIVTDRR